MERSSGILMNISSLPSPYGIGTLGKSAYEFVDFLVSSSQKYWQVLPINPTSYGDSPYQSFSTYAGNPYFIDFDILISDGMLEKKDVEEIDFGNGSYVDYKKLYYGKYKVLYTAYKNTSLSDEFYGFISHNAYWLDDYAIFMSAKSKNNGRSWMEWEDTDLKLYNKEAVAKFAAENKTEMDFWRFMQYLFFKQYNALKHYANNKGIKIIGDIPIYVSTDSADVWGNKEMFLFDENNNPKYVAGCPPDYFSADGQLWGNPIYNWNHLKSTDYKWWISRLKSMQNCYDVIRIDHFRGFEAYYSIDFKETTARNGRWVKGPGIEFVNKIKEELQGFEIIAEDLGYLTKEVYELLAVSGYPGMKVLQFAFDSNEDNDYLPHNYYSNCVVYTGTHDNNTTRGWFDEATRKDLQNAIDYAALTKEEGYVWGMIRLAFSSVANLAIIPLQDYLNFGEECRMNRPSTIGINWKWRLCNYEELLPLTEKIYKITKLYGR